MQHELLHICSNLEYYFCTKIDDCVVALVKRLEAVEGIEMDMILDLHREYMAKVC